jgi:hydrogenase maturation protease
MSLSAAGKLLVVAVGNPDRGDDAVGALVAARLTGQVPPGIEVVHRAGNLLDLIEIWSGCDTLVCVDAAAPMGRPGRIHRIDASAGALPQGPPSTSTHGFGLAEAIDLARALHALPPRVIVYAVEGARFDPGAGMTPAVAAAVGTVVDRILAEVPRLRPAAVESASHA